MRTRKSVHVLYFLDVPLTPLKNQVIAPDPPLERPAVAGGTGGGHQATTRRGPGPPPKTPTGLGSSLRRTFFERSPPPLGAGSLLDAPGIAGARPGLRTLHHTQPGPFLLVGAWTFVFSQECPIAVPVKKGTLQQTSKRKGSTPMRDAHFQLVAHGRHPTAPCASVKQLLHKKFRPWI